MNRFYDYTDQEFSRILSLIAMSDEDFSLRYLDHAVSDTILFTDSDSEEA